MRMFGSFANLVEEAAEALERGDKLPEQLFEAYVQKPLLDHSKYICKVKVEGLITNLGSAQFGSAEKSGNKLEVLKDKDGCPIIPSDPFRGAMRSRLLAISREKNIGDAAVCKMPVSSRDGSYVVDCGTCLACGLMGFMRAVDGKSFGSRVAVHAGRPLNEPVLYVKAGVVKDAATSTIRGAEIKAMAEKNADKEDEKGTNVFYYRERYSPGKVTFPLIVTISDPAVAEAGLVLKALYMALAFDGVGKSLWTTWEDDDAKAAKAWKLTVLPQIGQKEMYTGAALAKLFDRMMYVADLALERGLFRPYEIRPLEAVSVDRAEGQVKG